MTEGSPIDRRVDDALDKILRAAGSGKLSSYMPYTQDRLREAMREVLALRCEQATGPDRELDLAIWRGITGDPWRWHEGFPAQTVITWDQYGQNAPGNPIVTLEELTASLDAALTLVPEGMRPSVGQNVHHGYWHAFVQSIVDSTPHQLGVADSNTSGALALCAAALRARAQMEGGK